MNLLELRKQFNLTQQDIAEVCGVRSQTVSSWEKERNKIPEDKISLIESTYGIELEKPDRVRYQVRKNSPEESAKKFIRMLNKDQGDLVRKATNDLFRSISACFKIYAAHKSEGFPLEGVLDIHEKWIIEKVTELYRVLKDLSE